MGVVSHVFVCGRGRCKCLCDRMKVRQVSVGKNCDKVTCKGNFSDTSSYKPKKKQLSKTFALSQYLSGLTMFLKKRGILNPPQETCAFDTG